MATNEVCYFYRKLLGSAVNSRASVQVLKDELSHRVDVIDQSEKEMPYRGTGWLEGYCTREYQRLVLERDSYSPDERKSLIAWLYHERPRLRCAKDYSWRAKVDLWFYWIFRNEAGWCFVAYTLPVTIERMKIVLTDPARVLRAIGRRVGVRVGGGMRRRWRKEVEPPSQCFGVPGVDSGGIDFLVARIENFVGVCKSNYLMKSRRIT